MIYDKTSVDYQINVTTLQEMERIIPMTLRERSRLRKWVYSGHDPETNPWGYYDSDGMQMCYLQAFRLEHGYTCGPWDWWKGTDQEIF